MTSKVKPQPLISVAFKHHNTNIKMRKKCENLGCRVKKENVLLPFKGTCSWVNGNGSPFATRICHSTRSCPTTISVTGCSTFKNKENKVKIKCQYFISLLFVKKPRYLKTGIHFHEIEVVRSCVYYELDCSGIVVSNCLQ